MKRFFFVVLTLLSSLLFVPHVSAHVGGGPPFLKINGKYAQTNPYYQGEAAFNVSQDQAPSRYPLSNPVHLEIDTTQLLIPPDVAAHSTFRWTVATGDTFTDYSKDQKFGAAVDFTFPHEGSYLIVLEAHADSETEFSVIDTIQLDMYKDAAYAFPKAAVDIHARSKSDSDPVTFSSASTVSPNSHTVKYLWDLGDGKLKSGKSVQADYSSGTPLSYLYHRVIDDHGFVSDVGFDVWDTNKKLDFHPFGNMTSAPMRFISDTSSGKSMGSVSPVLIGVIAGIPALILLLVVIMLLRRKKS